jgi:hypothetical protein
MRPRLRPLAVVAPRSRGAAHAQTAPKPASSPLRPALDAIRAEQLLARTRTLASDAFEGRGPGTRGEDSTVAYLEREFRALGLAPGNPDGTYAQDVTLVGYTGKAGGRFVVGGRAMELAPLTDVVAVARHAAPVTTVENSDVVFVGYGVTAPEFGWDDYAGVDVKGKTVVILINDPAVTTRGGRLDDRMFRGRAMTYYGRWTYKYEEATRRGAAAALIVHETGPAGYPWKWCRGAGARRTSTSARPAASRRGYPSRRGCRSRSRASCSARQGRTSTRSRRAPRGGASAPCRSVRRRASRYATPSARCARAT